MITKIEQMTHPLGIRFYKLHVDDFVSGLVWCVAYKYHGCIISSFVPTFSDCERVCNKAFGVSINWKDCSDLEPVLSHAGISIPTSYPEFTEWLKSIRSSFISL